MRAERIETFFCQTESNLIQEVKDSRPIEHLYWKKILFNHAKKTGHKVIITEEYKPAIIDAKPEEKP